MPRPQYSLKAILVIVAVLAVPLGMVVSGNDVLFGLGCFSLFVAGGGSLGYLVGGWKYALLGMAVGVCVAFVADRLVPPKAIPIPQHMTFPIEPRPASE
jgi:hypothetical protein